MGAFDKFKSAGKIYWDSSDREISKIPLRLGYTPNRMNEILESYYSKFGIDMFDDKNIDKLFEFYPIKGFTHSDLYNILKDVQSRHIDYVTDFMSYKKCLKAYYDVHGENTKWLVKIFVDRYDLERFDISPDDVWDDLNEMAGELSESLQLEENNDMIENSSHSTIHTSSYSTEINCDYTEKNSQNPKSYQSILQKYYKKYKDQVFLSNILQELNKITNKDTNTIAEDLRAIRKGLSVTDTNVNKSAFKQKSYEDILRKYYKKYKDQVFLSNILQELNKITNKDTNTIAEDLRAIRKGLSVTENATIKSVAATKGCAQNIRKDTISSSKVSEISDTVPLEIQKAIFGALVGDKKIYSTLDFNDMGEFHAYVCFLQPLNT